MPEKLIIKGRDTRKVVAIDIEKTRPGPGNRPREHTIEVGMVRLGLCEAPWGQALTIHDHLSTLIRPPVPINNTCDHGITGADIVNAPTLADAASAILGIPGRWCKVNLF